MRFVEFLPDSRVDVLTDDIRAVTQPYMVFLGGLLHVQDIDTQKGFSNFLQKLRGPNNARIFMPLDETVTSTADLTEYMYAYGRNEAAPSEFMHAVYDGLIAPYVNAINFNNAVERTQLKQRLSNMGLIGYSYGTSLIQQLGEITATGLVTAMKAQGITNPGIHAASICSAVKAVNIGPVSKFKYLSADGDIDMLEPNDPYYADAMTIFSQASFLMSDDKIVQRSYNNELLGPSLKNPVGVDVLNTQTTTYYIDYVGYPTHAAAGFFVLPDAQVFPKIITSYDFMIHDLRTYMNVKEVQGNLAVYPSIAIAPVLRTSANSMFKCELGDAWLKNLNAEFSSPAQRASLVNNLHDQRAEFDAVLEQFKEKTFFDAIEFLKTHVANAREEQNKAAQKRAGVTEHAPSLSPC